MSVTITGQEVGALDRAAGLVLSAKADLDGLLGTLSGQVALGSRWQGAGGRAFASAYAEWERQQVRVTAKLQWFHDQLTAVERLNLATDQSQAAALGGLAARLDPSPH
jgi:WXG100 family type VII secretion target